MLPALAHVRAARAFANRVQIERAHDAFHVLVALTTEKLDAQPIRPGMPARRRHWHGWSVRDNVKGVGHYTRVNLLFYAVSELHTNTLIQPFSYGILNSLTAA